MPEVPAFLIRYWPELIALVIFLYGLVAVLTTTTPGVRIYTIRPVHNPIGPFDFRGGYDDRSGRPQPLGELMTRGYEDAYHQFVEPVVGASGERLTERI